MPAIATSLGATQAMMAAESEILAVMYVMRDVLRRKRGRQALR